MYFYFQSSTIIKIKCKKLLTCNWKITIFFSVIQDSKWSNL